MDLSGGFGRSPQENYTPALLLPILVWVAALSWGMLRPRREPRPWLAGDIAQRHGRLWILMLAVPPASLLLLVYPDLGGGPGAYPAGAWSTLLILTASLAGAALSRAGNTSPSAEERATPEAAAHEVKSWPAALRAKGIMVTPVLSRRAGSLPSPTATTPLRTQIEERLQILGASHVSPHLIDAAASLLDRSDEPGSSPRPTFVCAPDHCGQEEITAVAAAMTDQRHHARTLVITSADPRPLRDTLAHWLPDPSMVEVVDPRRRLEDGKAYLIVSDAQSLSDHLLAELRSSRRTRIGLIIWWHLEQFTGVLGANLWAISRRLHRILMDRSLHDVRTLTFSRGAAPDAQLRDFQGRLLPNARMATEKHIPAEPVRPLRLFLLEKPDGNRELESSDLPPGLRRLSLVSAKASIEAGWSTSLGPFPDLTVSERNRFGEQPIGDSSAGRIADGIAPTPAAASARILQVTSSNALSLLEVVAQGGRASEVKLDHHVGLILSGNPYLRHFILSLRDLAAVSRAFDTSRRLVGASPQPRILRQHLILALGELPSTKKELEANFFSDHVEVARTLEEIDKEKALVKVEIRYVDTYGHRKFDVQFKGLHHVESDRRPLRPVGPDLIEVRDPPGAGSSGGQHGDAGLRMLVDYPRLLIDAYPHRVFLSGGQRFVVDRYDSPETIRGLGQLTCRPEDVNIRTERRRRAQISNITSSWSDQLHGLARNAPRTMDVTLQYTEHLSGVVRVRSDAVQPEESFDFDPPLKLGFSARGFVVGIPKPDHPRRRLHSLAHAVRFVLPVYIGVEEDDFEVVPLVEAPARIRRGKADWEEKVIYGLVVVDLHPGGIGLVDVMRGDPSLVADILRRTSEWLEACDCRREDGCPHCMLSPTVKAASGGGVSRGAAVEILREILGERPVEAA
jgi:hypothetical protein